MAACERCWNRAYSPFGGQIARYHELLKFHTCTPEEQAGPNAQECPVCRRKSVHQFAKVCVICHWDLALTNQEETE